MTLDTNIISKASPECKGTTLKKDWNGELHWECSLAAILETSRLLINGRLREIASLSHSRRAWKQWRQVAVLRNESDVQDGQGVYASGAITTFRRKKCYSDSENYHTNYRQQDTVVRGTGIHPSARHNAYRDIRVYLHASLISTPAPA